MNALCGLQDDLWHLAGKEKKCSKELNKDINKRADIQPSCIVENKTSREPISFFSLLLKSAAPKHQV